MVFKNRVLFYNGKFSRSLEMFKWCRRGERFYCRDKRESYNFIFKSYKRNFFYYI